MCHGISPGHLQRRTPPRLCDPPCSEEQAGIGPISQKPELLTSDWEISGGGSGAPGPTPAVSDLSAHAVNDWTKHRLTGQQAAVSGTLAVRGIKVPVGGAQQRSVT